MTVEEDDLQKPLAAMFGLPRNLDGMSVENLVDYRSALEQELVRVDAAMEHRNGVRAGAEALFKN
ncbi:DUF1192 domain-containing protein [Thalassospira xianhensis]|uniref:DUF1192 domain-containing protein n=1 Tax=Thalassospira xianhensis MCCC 1A02616 TaxID=1177929 RepID=A0A367U7Y2_9PROT|nr:DUF1192 domain-containing protein [Thalassospira xianhensis]RCK04121.1 hypothetical protein TH5_21805 [Thalassospira xianhensis MCCC 1A02616]UKV13374.1 DUF1192 domain-containing protein [Thalassospiraceae bacterium SW-3-3]